MLRIVRDQEDPVQQIFEAYLEARGADAEIATNLRRALEKARQAQPAAKRVYDLERRVRRALARFRSVSKRSSRSRGDLRFLPPPRRLAPVHDQAPKVGA